MFLLLAKIASAVLGSTQYCSAGGVGGVCVTAAAGCSNAPDRVPPGEFGRLQAVSPSERLLWMCLQLGLQTA